MDLGNQGDSLVGKEKSCTIQYKYLNVCTHDHFHLISRSHGSVFRHVDLLKFKPGVRIEKKGDLSYF